MALLLEELSVIAGAKLDSVVSNLDLFRLGRPFASYEADGSESEAFPSESVLLKVLEAVYVGLLLIEEN